MKIFIAVVAVMVSVQAHAEESSSLDISQVEISSEILKTETSAKKWKFALDSEFYVNEGEQRDKGAETRVTSYHLASAKYAYDSTTTLKVVPTFELNSIPSDKDRAKNVKDEVQNGKTFGGARFGDPFVAYVKNKGSILGSDPMYTEVRYYLPLSEVSREWESVGIVRLDYILPWTVGKWTFSYYLNPRLFLESHAFADHPTVLSFREHGMVSYNFTDTWSSYGMVGHRWALKEQNFLKNDQTTYVLEVGVTKVFTKNVAVTLYLDNLFQEGKEDIQLFAANKNDFTLYTSLNF